MRDKPVVLITGATDGLGKLTAQRLTTRGARVLLHGRNPAKGEALAAELRQGGRHEVVYHNADLASLRQCQALADAVLRQEERLDLLINNAGVGPRAAETPRRESQDGHELFFAVNYLAGYLLTRRLLPLLRRSAPARIINVASIGQQPIDFDDPLLQQGYDDARAYRQSKLAQIMFTFDLAAELEGSGVSVNCLHPATLMDSGMVRNSAYFPGPLTSLEQGAEALEYLALSEELEGLSGKYFDGKTESRANEQAYDPEARRRLRELSEALLKQ